MLVPKWLEGLTVGGTALACVAAGLMVLAIAGTSVTFDSVTISTGNVVAIVFSAALAIFGSLYYGA